MEYFLILITRCTCTKHSVYMLDLIYRIFSSILAYVEHTELLSVLLRNLEKDV